MGQFHDANKLAQQYLEASYLLRTDEKNQSANYISEVGQYSAHWLSYLQLPRTRSSRKQFHTLDECKLHHRLGSHQALVELIFSTKAKSSMVKGPIVLLLTLPLRILTPPFGASQHWRIWASLRRCTSVLTTPASSGPSQALVPLATVHGHNTPLWPSAAPVATYLTRLLLGEEKCRTRMMQPTITLTGATECRISSPTTPYHMAI